MPTNSPRKPRREKPRRQGLPKTLVDLQSRRELTSEILPQIEQVLASMYDRAAPRLYRSVALFLFYVLKANRSDRNREKISGQDLATCINGGARYFIKGEFGDESDIADWRIRNFALRKSERPESQSAFFELVRLASLIYDGDISLQQDPFVEEILKSDSGFDFPKVYKLAQRGDINGAMQLVELGRRRSTTSSMYRQLAEALGLSDEDGHFLQRIFWGDDVGVKDRPSAKFKAYRLASIPGEAVVSTVEVRPIYEDDDQTIKQFLGFETHSLDRGGRERTSRGYVFYMPQTGVYFIGAVGGGLGFNFLVLPLPLSPVDTAYSGLVVTPDNRRTGRPVASRIELVRCGAEDAEPRPDEVGLVPLHKLPEAISSSIENRVEFKLRSRVAVNVRTDGAPSVQRQVDEYDELADELGYILDSLVGGHQIKRNPFSRDGSSATEMNPFSRANLLFDSALVCAKEDH